MAGQTPAAPETAPKTEWLDTMVKRLMTTLEQQLAAIAQAEEGGDARSRAADARTLAALERTLERLSKLERERAAVREKKITPHDGQARTALERRLDKRLAAAAKAGGAGKPQRG